jgi:hypothetical protein
LLIVAFKVIAGEAVFNPKELALNGELYASAFLFI